MYCPTIIGFFLAALAAASPSRINAKEQREMVTFIMTEPDCAALKDYCTNCNPDDFNCETDPRCEWCYEHEQFPPRA